MSGLRNLLENLRRSSAASEDFLLEAENVPNYVAIIMDGNGRWAARRHMPAIAGHREGARALKRTIKAARQAGIRELTVYAFSTENWQRPDEEVSALMKMFGDLIDKEVPKLESNDVRVRFIGRRKELSHNLLKKMEWAEKLTDGNSTMTLFIAFNYGGRSEIIDAAMAAAGNGLAAGDHIDFSKYLYAPEMHDPELLIRTSGEQRVSNFLLWQCAYSELFFSEKLWPDFNERDLMEAFSEFSRRKRRFGAR